MWKFLFLVLNPDFFVHEGGHMGFQFAHYMYNLPGWIKTIMAIWLVAFIVILYLVIKYPPDRIDGE